MQAWVCAGWVALFVPGALGCATATGKPQPGDPLFGEVPQGDASAQGNSPLPCTTCSTGDAGNPPPQQTAPPPSDDAAAPQDDAPSTPPSDDASPPPPLSLPPLPLPDGGSTATGDGGVCTTKICIDPVFDCPLQGCFNGCVNFHCM